jgi:hypothetical protein
MTNCEAVRNRTQVAVKQELAAIKPGKDVVIGELATMAPTISDNEDVAGRP